jgi:hypothetical protein
LPREANDNDVCLCKVSPVSSQIYSLPFSPISL